VGKILTTLPWTSFGLFYFRNDVIYIIVICLNFAFTLKKEKEEVVAVHLQFFAWLFAAQLLFISGLGLNFSNLK
jgi:hypothetical protein